MGVDSVGARTFGDLFQECVIGGFRLVGEIERQRRSPRSVRMRTNPRIFVGESPGLYCGAALALQTGANDTAVNFGLTKKVFVLGYAIRVDGQRHVQFS